MWLKRLLEEIGCVRDTPVPFYEDNRAVIDINECRMSSKRTRHVEVKFFCLREYVEQGHFEMHYVNTKKNPADALTKPLGGLKLKELLIDKYMVRQDNIDRN